MTMSSETRRTPHLLLAGVLALGIPCARAADTPPSQDPPFKHYIGYHGPDGTQVYTNSKPPTKWDGAKGENILWKADMPFVGNGSPIVVKGRVFVMSEPGYKSGFPELLCLDADTGKILWQREINHLGIAIPDAAKRDAIVKEWQDYLAWRREFGMWHYDRKYAQKGPNLMGIPAPEQEEVRAKVDEYASKRLTSFPEYDLYLEINREGGENHFGTTYPTPCSDGTSVFIVTGWRQYACFDLAGNQQWLCWLPRMDKADYHGCGGWRSPVLWRDMFIADSHDIVRAFDKKTGEIRWSVRRSALGIAEAKHLSPKIFTAGGADVLWCAGPLAIRLADGKPLTIGCTAYPDCKGTTPV